ncbi:MAG: 30S ribosomal protein S18 [Firmicutes bacterium]|nr:30S ribosomal protein S18 [Bacillota bacterium]
MDEKAPPKKSKKAPKKKVCPFCTEKGRVIDYKEAQKLKRYITEKGKIIPRRSNGLCALHQREVAQAIKRARTMALLPFKAE